MAEAPGFGAGVAHQLGEHGRTFGRCRGAPAGQHAIAPELERASEEFFAAYKASANALLSEASGEDWAASTGKYRKVVWAAMHGSREQTLKVLREATA